MMDDESPIGSVEPPLATSLVLVLDCTDMMIDIDEGFAEDAGDDFRGTENNTANAVADGRRHNPLEMRLTGPRKATITHHFEPHLLSTIPPNTITTTTNTTFTMAAFTLTFTPATVSFGRSGYNKDGDDDTKGNKGRSGYNGPDMNFGRSGYNKDGDDDDTKGNKGRSGYNKTGDDDDEQ
ncbi:hypothetical protein G7046_g3169 [Stylonectria norvegica]|nr:hypothetical protein G7046_g3169 [Stylonectria norvegica]